MTEMVGIRELKAHLSRYLRQVKRGATITITEHGTPVGRIVPVAQTTDEQLSDLQKAGLVAWNGRRIGTLKPVGKASGKKTVGELLLEGRD